MLVLLLWQPQAPSLSPLCVALYTVLAPPYPLVGIFYPLVGISIHCASHSQPVFHSLRMVCLLACGGSPCTSITCYCRYEILQGCIQSPAPAIIPRNNTTPAKIVLGCTPCASHVWAHNHDNCIWVCIGTEGAGQPCVCFLGQKARGQHHLGLLRVPPSKPPSPQQHHSQLHFSMVSFNAVLSLAEVACTLCKRFRLCQVCLCLSVCVFPGLLGNSVSTSKKDKLKIV